MGLQSTTKTENKMKRWYYFSAHWLYSDVLLSKKS